MQRRQTSGASLPSAPTMAWALDEFFSSLESEFDVDIDDATRSTLTTPGEVIEWLVEESDVASDLDEDSRREQVAGMVGELMAETLGVTRYRDHWRFVEDLHVR